MIRVQNNHVLHVRLTQRKTRCNCFLFFCSLIHNLQNPPKQIFDSLSFSLFFIKIIIIAITHRIREDLKQNQPTLAYINAVMVIIIFHDKQPSSNF